jgi:hypothetical protein
VTIRSINHEPGRGAKTGVDPETLFRNKWLQYRMKKPPKEDGGKNYNILTGIYPFEIYFSFYVRLINTFFLGGDIDRPAAPRHIGRVSIEKINNIRFGTDGDKRTYNIISNAPLSIS